jgi:hypothetical protein
MACLKLTLWILFAALVLSTTVACKKRATQGDDALGTTVPVPEARNETGWPLYEVKAEGFGLALPPEWRQFDMNPKTFEAKFQEALKQNPQFEPMLGNLRQQVTSGVKFFGFDPATVRTGFATNVNVIRHPLPGRMNLDAAATGALKEIESLPTVNKPVAHARVNAAAGDCERFRFKMVMKTPNGKNLAISTTQFLFVKENESYVVTLTTLPEYETKYAATFDKIGQSFQFIK